jgi:hypothetical protein
MKMEKIKGVVTAMIPVALGVAAGMLIYEQVKKQTAATSSFSNAGGAGGCEYDDCDECPYGGRLVKCKWNGIYCQATCEGTDGVIRTIQKRVPKTTR